MNYFPVSSLGGGNISFNVGDRVTCIRGSTRSLDLVAGKDYIVTTVGLSMLSVKTPGGVAKSAWYKNRFIPAKAATAAGGHPSLPRLFTPGDIVRCTEEKPGLAEGGVYVVQAVQQEGKAIQVGGMWCKSRRFELVRTADWVAVKPVLGVVPCVDMAGKTFTFTNYSRKGNLGGTVVRPASRSWKTSTGEPFNVAWVDEGGKLCTFGHNDRIKLAA